MLTIKNTTTKMRHLLLTILASAAITATAQTTREEIAVTPEKAGGVYYAYPVSESLNTPAPKGYKPFYVSHFARHGSRYLISDNDYKTVMDVFDSADRAGALTPLGKSVKARLDSIWTEAQGRGGELTPLGRRQHQGIAQRMYKAYPEAFTDDARITAASTTVMRCAHSMFAFIEGLKEQNPRLLIPAESSERNMHYLNYHSKESGKYSNDKAEWYLDYKKFRNEKTRPDRLVRSLFADSTFVRRHVDPQSLMTGLYWIAVDGQNIETPVTLLDIFTTDELFDLWEIYNYSFYATNSSYPLADGQHIDNAKNLLRNIVETADDYIARGDKGATLRFAHDGNIIPLTALMQFPSCAAYETNPYALSRVYSNFKISPMASNVQAVFFKNKAGDVIVKFMLNEREVSIPAKTDMYPFYRWEDARAALQKILDTPSREYIPAASIR